MSYKYKLSRRLAQIFYSFPALAITFLFAACGGGDTKSSFGPAIDTTISSIVVTPEKTIAKVGDTIHIEAYGSSEMVYNAPVEVDWQASGGSITPAGDFKADAPGVYKVSGWTRNEAHVADTVSLTVQASAGAGGGGPDRAHEPLGFTMVSFQNFDTKEPNGWRDRGDPWYTIVQGSGVGGSAGHFGRATYPVGFVGGRGPINTLYDFGGTQGKSLYASFWMRLSPNFLGSSNGVNKILHIWSGGTSKVVFSVTGHGTGRLSPQMRLQNIGAGNRGVSFNLDPNVNNKALTRDQWFHVEILLTGNTPGQGDGEIRWWVDGTEIGHYNDIGYAGSSTSSHWEIFSWNPTWGGPADVITSTMAIDMDDVYLSAP